MDPGLEEGLSMELLSAHETAPTPTPPPREFFATILPKPSAAPAATVTVTATPPPQPSGDTLNDYLQGWGSLLAAVVAVVGLGVALHTGWRDRKEADERLKDERAEARRRLMEERETADARLQRQFEEQRERDRRQFLAQELLLLGDLYGESLVAETGEKTKIAIQRIHVHMKTVPGRYASLLKEKMSLGELDNDAAFESARRLQALGLRDKKGIDNLMIYEEIAENIREILGKDA